MKITKRQGAAANNDQQDQWPAEKTFSKKNVLHANIIKLLLVAGVLIGGTVLALNIAGLDTTSMDTNSHGEPSKQAGDAETAKGPHRGKLLSKKDFQLEVTIYEPDIPPEFRIYPFNNGKPINPDDVELTIELHRLWRTDVIQFKKERDYLLGNKVVEEPHSFDVIVIAEWKGHNYKWEYSSFEGRAELTDDAIKRAGIVIETAGPVIMDNIIKLTGEIDFNADKVAHVVPRFTGVVREVKKDEGDYIKKGEIVAILESRELADAKSNYLNDVKLVSLAKVELEREKIIFKNTTLMLDLLKKGTSLDDLQNQLKNSIIGESRAQLIPAYAKLNFAKATYHREKDLFEKEISPESDYLLALEGYKSAEAKYIALIEKTSYQARWALLQKEKTADTADLNLQTATQKLLALGLSQSEIKKISINQKLTRYEIRSPIKGTVIEKHITIGEAVKKDDNIYVLADLSDVWGKITIPSKDLQSVKEGQRVSVKSEKTGLKANGVLAHIHAAMDEKTQSVTGKVVIPNKEKKWRPGQFITVEIVKEESSLPVAVSSEAIQTFRDWSVVFVKYGNLFEVRPLELGRNNGQWVEILEGLAPGEKYAAQNSFVLKAEVGKEGATHDH